MYDFTCCSGATCSRCTGVILFLIWEQLSPVNCSGVSMCVYYYDLVGHGPKVAQL